MTCRRARAMGLVLPVIFLAVLRSGSLAQTRAQTGPLVERVADTGFLQLEADSFRALDLRHQALAYWLVQASIAIDPIIYDQLSSFGLREKRALEEIIDHPTGVAPEVLARIRSYALLFWANRGNHNETTGQKFLPAFTTNELTEAALRARQNGAFKTKYGDLPALPTDADVRREILVLGPSLFDPAVEPAEIAKTPPAGQDILQASSNTFYRGVSLNELKGFHETHPLNSRVVKGTDGAIHEDVYRAGTPDGHVPPGLYAAYLA